MLPPWRGSLRLPHSGPGGLDLAAQYFPSSVGNLVGGDWYDALELPGGHTLLTVGDLTGHGVGRSIHEAPEVPNYDPGGRSPLLTEGLVIAVEPLVAERSGAVRVTGDRWTIATRDGGWTALAADPAWGGRQI